MKKGKIIVKGGYVYCDGNLCGSKITIISYQKDEEKNLYNVKFSFMDAHSAERKEVIVEVSKGDLNAPNLHMIMVKGGGLNLDSKTMFRYFNELDAEVVNARSQLPSLFESGKVDFDGNHIPPQIAKFPEVEKIHESVGWSVVDGERVFFGENKLTSSGVVEKSGYRGTMKITPRGSFEVYKEMIKNLVVGHTPLEAIISVAGSATVLGFAKTEWSESIVNSVLHIYSDTTEGKSAASELFASLGGLPDSKDDKAVFITYDATNASIKKKLSGNNGYPVVLDELSNCTKSDITSLLYALASGQDKERLGSGGRKLQKLEKFTTMILSNGEESILAKCKNNGGLRVRVFEMFGVEWTKSDKHAEEISRIVKNNYGHVTPMIAQKLLEDTEQKWHERFKHWKEMYMKKAKENGINNKTVGRVSKTLALFMTSADILEEILEVHLSKNQIFDFFYKKIICEIDNEGNIGIHTYNWIREYFISNKDKFPEQEWNAFGDIKIPSSAEGKVLTMKSPEEKIMMENGKEKVVTFNRTICLTKTQAERILLKGNFSDIRVCMNALKRMGLLMTSNKDTITAKFTLRDEVCTGYRIKIPQEDYYNPINFMEEDEDNN